MSIRRAFAMNVKLHSDMDLQCSRFFNFDLTENEKTLRLDVSGQPETLAIVEDLFG